MNAARQIVPQPVTTLAIMALWLVLAPAFSVGNLILAAVLGLSIPHFTGRFWPDRPRLLRPLLAARLVVRVIGDIVIANFQVARLVLGPVERLRPAFVEVPIAIADPFAATLLGSIISLTPGTVTIDIDMETRVLHIHALDVGDEAALISVIQRRYEAPLKEIFGC